MCIVHTLVLYDPDKLLLSRIGILIGIRLLLRTLIGRALILVGGICAGAPKRRTSQQKEERDQNECNKNAQEYPHPRPLGIRCRSPGRTVCMRSGLHIERRVSTLG